MLELLDCFKDLTKDLIKDLSERPKSQNLPSRGTLLRWGQEKKDRESGEYKFDPKDIKGSEGRRRKRFYELWLLELETDAFAMISKRNDGWPDNFVYPLGLKTAILRELLSSGGYTPLGDKLKMIQKLKRN